MPMHDDVKPMKECSMKPTWFTPEQFSQFKQVEFAKMDCRPDQLELSVVRIAELLGYQPMFSADTPWVLEGRLRILSVFGEVLTEGRLRDVAEWLLQHKPRLEEIRRAAKLQNQADAEAKALDAITLKATTGIGQASRL
jgi:hypothetical protein